MVKTPRAVRSPSRAAGVPPKARAVRTAREPDIRVLAVKGGRAIEVQRVAVRARRWKSFKGRGIEDRSEVGRAAPLTIQRVTRRNVKITCAESARAVGREVESQAVHRETQGEVISSRVVDRLAEMSRSPQADSLLDRIETKRSSLPLRPDVKNNFVSSAETVGYPLPSGC